MRRAGVVGLALGLGLGLVAGPAMANDDWNWGPKWADDAVDAVWGDVDHDDAWGVDVEDEDGPAWGLDVTDHGPAWGVQVDDEEEIELPIVFDDEVLGEDGSGWDMGLSAFGIDDASFTGHNPVADAYLGLSGWAPTSTLGWTNDREGWLGGLLGDDSWVIGGLW